MNNPESRESDAERNFQLFAASRSHQDSNLGQQHYVKATNTIFALNAGAAAAMLTLYGSLHDDIAPLLSFTFAVGEAYYVRGAIVAARSIVYFEESISMWATIWQNAALNCKNEEEMFKNTMTYDGQLYSGVCLSGLSAEKMKNSRQEYKVAYETFLFATCVVAATFISNGLG